MACDEDDFARGKATHISLIVSLFTDRTQLGLPSLPEEMPTPESLMTEDGEPTQVLKDLHVLLMETAIEGGKLVCGNCGHMYEVKEGIANFLLPSHLV